MPKLEDLFKSEPLLKRIKKGKLDEVFERFGEFIKVRRFLGRGKDATVFEYKDNQVLKICTKEIGFFKHYGGTAHDFKRRMEELSQYFAPPKEILYEDDHVFIYTQDNCVSLRKAMLSPQIVRDYFGFLKFMIDNNIVVTDIAPHNLGVVNGKFTCFDYHGLGPLSKRNILVIDRMSFWSRLSRNVIRFMFLSQGIKEKAKKYDSILLFYDKTGPDALEKIRKDRALPNNYMELLEYMAKKKEDSAPKMISQLIARCADGPR
jgi:hypothetical protein